MSRLACGVSSGRNSTIKDHSLDISVSLRFKGCEVAGILLAQEFYELALGLDFHFLPAEEFLHLADFEFLFAEFNPEDAVGLDDF